MSRKPASAASSKALPTPLPFPLSLTPRDLKQMNKKTN
jgi:hypothetical protein